jgi:hypothetical protein
MQTAIKIQTKPAHFFIFCTMETTMPDHHPHWFAVDVVGSPPPPPRNQTLRVVELAKTPKMLLTAASELEDALQLCSRESSDVTQLIASSADQLKMVISILETYLEIPGVLEN